LDYSDRRRTTLPLEKVFPRQAKVALGKEIFG
jgi:hypothetical protein